MSLWQFILIADDNTQTVIENPRGWDAGQVKITRDREWYGIFFDYVFQTLEFHGEGATLIKQEYDTKGLNGSMSLQINFYCSEGESWDEFYKGRLSFPRYSDNCGDLCIVTIGLEQDDDVMLMRNNYEQSVDLNKNIAFDDTTVLTNYLRLNTPLLIPGRGIPLTSAGKNTETHSFDLLGFPTWNNISPGGTTGSENGGLLPIFDTTTVAEFLDTTLPTGPYYDTTVVFNAGNNSVGTPPFISLRTNTTIKCQPTNLVMTYRIKGRLQDITTATRSVGMNLNIFIGPNAAQVVQLISQPMVSYDSNVVLTSEFDVTLTSPISMQAGDRLYFYAQIGYVKTSSNALQFLIIEFDPETTFNLTGLSVCEDTEAQVYLINEATSRTVEAITNDRIRFYSTFFGRIDSQPYALPADTCAGLKAIVNGLNLRRRLLNDGSQPGCFITLRGIFEALRGMWNIGQTIEPDLERPGFNRLRFEDWRYFFQEETGLIFNYPTNVKRTVDTARAYSRFQTGYTKWEAEQYSGLNEFMTEREYRNGINSIDTALDRRVVWILASYTAEIARRQDTGTDDYRYDNDIFAFCLNRAGSGYEVEQMLGNATGIQNISDPDTCYNGRVSPARNAMRWFNCFMQSLRQLQPDSKMYFTKGTGNYIAQFALDNCDIAGTPLIENQDLTPAAFDNQDDANPPVYPETLTFSHPLNYNLFKRIKNEPALRFKTIQVNCNGTLTPAWFYDITYNPEKGSADIIAWPKNTAQLPGPPPPEVCEATIEDGSVTMDNWTFDTQTADIDFVEATPGATLWAYIITQGNIPGSGTGFNGTTVVHPFTVTGITPGTWSVFIVPYCDIDNVGQNYGAGTFEFVAPELLIQLRVTYQVFGGGVLKSYTLIAEPVGSATFPFGFSFKFGECNSQGFCNGYPGASNPGSGSTLTAVAGQTSASAQGVGNMILSASVTNVTIYDRSGITPAQITIAAGETFTVNNI